MIRSKREHCWRTCFEVNSVPLVRRATSLRIAIFEIVYALVDIFMQCGLSGTGKGDKIKLRFALQKPIQLFKDRIYGYIFPSSYGEICGAAAFAIDAVERACLQRDQIDSERDTETARGDGTKKIALLHKIFHPLLN